MNRNTLRIAITILTVLTAGIHLLLVFAAAGQGDMTTVVMFSLNGLGYLALLAALLLNLPMLAGRERLVHYAFIAYTAVTIVGYFAVNGAGSFSNPIGLFDKLVEILLVAALWLHLQQVQRAA